MMWSKPGLTARFCHVSVGAALVLSDAEGSSRRPADTRRADHVRTCLCRIAMLLGVVLALTSARAGKAAIQPQDRKAIIVVMHGVSWEELAAAHVPSLQALLRRAAVGVMNSRVLESREASGAYLTIGAGRGAVASPRWPLLDPRPTAAPAALENHTQALAELREANQHSHTQAVPGLLGSALREEGLRTGILFLMDAAGGPWSAAPPATLMAMDRSGRVDWVDWVRIGRDQLRLRPALAATDILSIDVGQLWRRPVPVAPPAPAADAAAVTTLRHLAVVFDHVVRIADPATHLLIIVSPTCPPYQSPKNMAYAPIAIIGPGFEPGLLTSASTRRLGVVSNTDIAPTILRYFGIWRSSAGAGTRPGAGVLHATANTTSMSGHPMTWRHSRQPLRDILAISRRGVRLFDLQWRFAPVYALGEFFIFLGVGAVLTFAPAAARRSRRRLQMLLLLGTSLPLALFFLGPLDPGGVVRPYVILAALACALTWLSWRASAPVASLGAMLTVTAGLVALDAMTGGHLLGSFMMNFGVMYGSRFYGIGNETMGFVVACAAIGAAALLQESGTTKRRMWALALWFVAIAVVIGAPFWGANWGGTITAAFAFAVAFAGIRAGRPRLRHWAVALIAAVAAGALAVALDLLGDARTWSHIGGSAGLVSAGGLPAAFDIVTRKALGNLRIMTIVPGLWMTLVVWAAGAFLVFKPPARLRAALAANSAVWAGLAGGIAAALIAILVNDSGIVAASSVMGVTASSIAYTAVTGSEASP